MNPRRISELKTKVDEALEAGELSGEAREALIEVLTPDAHEQTWPDVEVVLHVAEHPVVAAKMRQDRLPEPLETALVEALSAVLPLLGARAFGPLQNFAERARKRLDAERRKYELVVERLDGLEDADGAVRLLRNYISTEPAPLFVARLRQLHPAWVDEAEGQTESGADLEVFGRNAALIDALENPSDADADQLAQELAELAADPDVSALTLRRALTSGSQEQQLVAAAVVTFDDQADLGPTLLNLVLSGAKHAAALAVMAAQLTPMMARQVFSQFLAEAAWQNPEEPEAKITRQRTHAILSARCVLPKIGSPMEPVELDGLPAALDSDELRAVPRLIEEGWTLWQEIRDASA